MSAVPSVVALQKPAFDSPPLAAAQEVPAPAGLRLACDWSWAGGTEAVPTPAALRRLGGGWRRVETVRAGLQRLACDWRRLEVQGVPASAGLRKPASGWMGEACLVEPGGGAPLGDGRSRSWASACYGLAVFHPQAFLRISASRRRAAAAVRPPRAHPERRARCLGGRQRKRARTGCTEPAPHPAVLAGHRVHSASGTGGSRFAQPWAISRLSPGAAFLPSPGGPVLEPPSTLIRACETGRSRHPSQARTPSVAAASRPNSVCKLRTASSVYFSWTTQLTLISEVEIIWMLMPCLAST